MRVVGIRHGESTYNVKGLCNDNPKKKVILTYKGKKQAKEAGLKLRKRKIEVIFCSQFPRTVQTAKEINKILKVKVMIDERLQERKASFDGKVFSEWKKEISKKNYFTYKPKGGESFQDEKKRMNAMIKDLKKSKYKAVLLVSHEEPLQALRCIITGISDKESYSNPIKNAKTIEFLI
jgi:broad specificity phosphatase PhoE